MRLLLLITVLLSIFYRSMQQEDGENCNEADMVTCFTNYLDEASYVLYTLKSSSILAIAQEECNKFVKLDECIRRGGETNRCTHNQIVDAAESVTELLVQRKHAGNILRTFYLLSYACSDAARNISRGHNVGCLHDQKIGEMTLEAGSYLAENFPTRDGQVECDVLSSKFESLVNATRQICYDEFPVAQQMFCNGLKHMFEAVPIQSEDGGSCPEFLCGEIIKKMSNGGVDNEIPTMDYAGSGADTHAEGHSADEPGSSNLNWSVLQTVIVLVICFLVSL